ncbi:MAG: prepilin-type N-terminal cleavage/methylation domain-containing protein [Cyanobacteriota bacterium]|nr:prepilin-type N-terminal cleavage/methylation domain-containing protein [Cyanobacteriota bacterium]
MRRAGAAGFTITELVVAVAIIAVGSSIAIAVTGREIRRERINSAAVGLSGWLEEVRRAALKGNPCTITITASSGIARGGILASAREVPTPALAPLPRDNRCQADKPYRVANELGNARVAISPSLTFSFGTLGTVTPTTDKELVLTLIQPGGQSDLARCLRIRGMMGFTEVGNRSGGSCTYPSRY